MSNILTILRFIMLLLSLFGAAVFLRKRTKIPYAFCMPLAGAFLVCILFFFSLFIQITAAIWVLFGAGILMLGYVILRREICRADILNRTNLFLLIGTLVLLFILMGRHLMYVDDFTHWATFARAVTEHQGLPDASEPLISFVSYPPASALWICYFSDITGSVSEDVWLFGQAFFTLVLISSLTYLPDPNSGTDRLSQKSRGVRIGFRILTFLFLLEFCAFAMLFGGTVFSLYVDGLLMAAGLTGTVFLLVTELPVYQKAFYSIPFALFMLLLKDTGFAFILSVFAILIYQAVKEHKEYPGGKKKGLVSILIVFFSVVITEFLWRLHTAIAFPEGGLTGGPADQAPHNSPEQIRQILYNFFYGKNRYIFLVIGFLLFLVIFYLICRGILKKAEPKRGLRAVRLLLFSVVHFLIYYAGLLYIYLFSMPTEHAMTVAEFPRYIAVEILYLIGICFCFVVWMFPVIPDAEKASSGEEKKNRRKTVLLILVLAADILFAAVLLVSTRFVKIRNYEGSPREMMHEMNPEGYQGDMLYYMPSVVDEYERNMFYWYGYYDLRNSYTELYKEDSDFDQLYQDHSHIMIFETDPRITGYMQKHGFSGEITTGMYDISK